MFKFGTSGIRDLTENLIKNHVAKDLAQHLYNQGWQTLTLGRDGRINSDKLAKEFIANFKGQVNYLDITTTPALGTYSGLAIMITASHNPKEYCGFKIYVNHEEQNTADLQPVPTYTKWDMLPRDIVIDCANGGLGHCLKNLGFDKIINYDGPINQDCGATHPENLSQYCKEHQLDIGFAVDGDADRCLVYLGDHILSSEETAYLIAKLTNLSRIVIDETVNSALEKHFEIVRCKVGGHAVIESMRKNNISLGAEKSGHYYFDKNFTSSDAVDTITVISNGYHEHGVKGLQKMLAEYKPYFQVTQNIRLNEIPANWEEILNELNFPKTVRKVIRKSGTEPLLRIMLESKNKSEIDTAWQQIKTGLNLQQ